MTALAAAVAPALAPVETCDLCGGREFRPRARLPEYLLFTGETFQLVECAGCRLCFVSPRPEPEAIGRYYPQDYFAHMGNQPERLHDWQKVAERSEAEPLGLFGRLLLQIREDVFWYKIPRAHGQKRILDVGSGSGKLLDVMRQLGWQTHALDPSEGAIARAKQKGHGGDVGTGEVLPHDDGSMDVVYMWHSLEHAHAPSKALAEAHRVLAPGGKLYLAVPNYASAQSKIFGPYWWSTDAPRHLYQFTRPTLTRYLERAGFRDLRVTTRTGATSWARALRHTVNGLFGAKLATDPAFLVGLCEVPVILGSLVRFFGVGSELRLTCSR